MECILFIILNLNRKNEFVFSSISPYCYAPYRCMRTHGFPQQCHLNKYHNENIIPLLLLGKNLYLCRQHIKWKQNKNIVLWKTDYRITIAFPFGQRFTFAVPFGQRTLFPYIQNGRILETTAWNKRTSRIHIRPNGLSPCFLLIPPTRSLYCLSVSLTSLSFLLFPKKHNQNLLP